MKEKYPQSEMLRGKGFSMSKPICANDKESSKQFAIVACPAESKKTISQGKLSSCEKSTRTLKSSKTSGQALTSKEKDFEPYWNDFCKEVSSKLWLPTKTALRDSATKLSNSLSNKTVANSWFSTEQRTAPKKNLQRICSTYSTSFLAGCTDSEDTVTKSRKIRVYPTTSQKSSFRQWIGVARFVYNQTIELLNQPGTKASWKEIKTGILQALPDWTKSTPYQIKSIAIRDACIAVREAKKRTKETGRLHKAQFRSRKQPKQSCYIPKSAVKNGGIYTTYTGELRWSENLPENFGDSRLLWHFGCWYLCVPFKQDKREAENQGRVVSLDPGVRTFLTWFSEYDCGKIGTHDIGRIQRLCSHLDGLISRSNRCSSSKKRKMRKAASRMRRKIKNLIAELHHKAARVLVDNFDIILLPTFEVSGMSRKIGRRINRKSVRSLLGFSHFRFKQFLKHKAREAGKLVVDVNEAYTSKTVSWTGEIISNLGGGKTIKSPKDGQEMDRDYNGARGIMLRALRDTASFRKESAIASNC